MVMNIEIAHELPRIETTTNKKFLRMFHGQGRFFQKAGGTPTPFTISQMAIFRDSISKKLVFFTFFYRILVKRALGRRRQE
jgi:hypothetical protein